MNVSEKVVIVTGGAAGIGLAAARAFARANAHVLITGRRTLQLDQVASGEPRIEALVADVAEPADAQRTVYKALELWGRIDVLINNAGAGAAMSLANASAPRIQGIYAVNAIGPTLLAAAAVAHLEKTRGAIVNVSSSLASKAVAGLADYAASKAALEHLTRCWAVELAPRGVRVNAIAAGPVESAFLQERMGYSDAEAAAIKEKERSAIPLGRRGTPEDVAHWILALASREAAWITGQVLGIDGGFVLA